MKKKCMASIGRSDPLSLTHKNIGVTWTLSYISSTSRKLPHITVHSAWYQLLKIWRINKRWICIIQFVYFVLFAVIVVFIKAYDLLNTQSVLNWVTSERDWIAALALLKLFRNAPAAFTKLNVKWIT